MIRNIALVAGGLVAVYACLLVAMWAWQERIVFQPPRAPASDVSARRVTYTTSDGVPLFAYLVGDCTHARPLVLAFHGNADVARWFVPWATKASRETGACVMLPEYRGYDGAAGTPSYQSSARDAVAALDYARNTLGVSADHTVYFGHSLGSAIAAELAVTHPPRALLLQSPFTNARAMAARMLVPGLSAFWTLISRVHFDTMARVRALGVPVWVSHGDKDMLIPVRMGRDVFAAAPHPGRLLIVPGAGHNDVPDLGGASYWSWFADAVRGAPTPTLGSPTQTKAAP